MKKRKFDRLKSVIFSDMEGKQTFCVLVNLNPLSFDGLSLKEKGDHLL